MGMYTTLKFDAPLNKRGIEVVEALHTASDRDYKRYMAGEYRQGTWATIKHLLPASSSTFYQKDRNTFIPFGAEGPSGGMPDWEKTRSEIIEGVWHVCCGLKNGHLVIESFLMHVLPYLVSKDCKAYSLFEGDENIKTFNVSPTKEESLG